MSPKKYFLKSGMGSTQDWNIYFRSNRNILGMVSSERVRGLSDDEKKRIARSIQEFQLGENSEGRNLSEFAKIHSEENGDPFYYENIKYFIREEQRHSRVLGLFMEKEGIEKLGNSFADSVFRHLRRYLGLEVSLMVLSLAEIVSLVYYRNLGHSTLSFELKAICREILKDEKMHLKFQGETLIRLRSENGILRRLSLDLFQWILLMGTCPVVWANHGKVLSIHHSFGSFWKRIWRIYFGFQLRIRKLSLGVDSSSESLRGLKEWGRSL